MRVIGGSAKGVRLAPVPPGTRPVSDRAREGLFSSLGDRVAGAVVLDLFAGTGALGIEALSRGAGGATFVDHSRASTSAIGDNLQRTRLAERAIVVTSEVEAYLRAPSGSPADIAFLDPPYDREGPELDDLLLHLSTRHLADGFTVALTRRKGSSAPALPLHWAVARQLHYGDSLVFLFREVGWA